MKQNTILELYYGKLKPDDMDMIEKEAYQKQGSALAERADRLRRQLPDELKEEFDRLCEEEMKSDEMLHRDGFVKGFRIGLRLAAEAFMKEDLPL